MKKQELAEMLKNLSFRLDVVSGAMLDTSDGEDDLHVHALELQGAAKKLFTWAEEVEE